MSEAPDTQTVDGGPTPAEPDDQTSAAEPEDPAAQAVADDERCEAVTTVGGNEYRCALEAAHDGEHAFQSVTGDTEPQHDFDVKKLEGENARHERALEKVYGPEWEHRLMCPLCTGEGFMTPLPAGAMPPELWDAVTALAGQVQGQDLQADQDYVVCDNCGGYGNTKIADSKLEGLAKQCDRCLGTGYVKTTAVTNVVQIPTVPQIPSTPPLPAPVSYGAPGPNDAWDRPTGHPHYGIPPAAVTG